MQLDTNDALASMSNSSLVGNSDLRAKKGRKIDPKTLEKYQQVLAIYRERPTEFTKKQLCEKHDVKYGNFMQWIKKQEPKKEIKFRPEKIQQPMFVGQSIVACTIDDLIDCIAPHIRDTIKEAIRDGVKMNKLKVIRA